MHMNPILKLALVWFILLASGLYRERDLFDSPTLFPHVYF